MSIKFFLNNQLYAEWSKYPHIPQKNSEVLIDGKIYIVDQTIYSQSFITIKLINPGLTKM